MTSSFPRVLGAWPGVRVANRKKIYRLSIATHESGGLSPFRGHSSALNASVQFIRAGAFNKRNVRESRLSRLPHHRGERARLRVSPCGPLAQEGGRFEGSSLVLALRGVTLGFWRFEGSRLVFGASWGHAWFLALRGVTLGFWRFVGSRLVCGFCPAWNEELRAVSQELGNGETRRGSHGRRFAVSNLGFGFR
jgi:hypothetical protein